MKTYTSLKKSSKNKSYKAATILIGSVLLVFGFFSMETPGIILGAFFIYLALYTRTVFVDAAGITTLYNAVFFKRSITYPFAEFQGILQEAGNIPEMNLGFVRNGMTQYSLFTRSDGEAIIRLAKEANPEIYIRTLKPRRRNFF
jgi:hypothetical protein